jgi:hypothetical protein
LKTDEKRMRTSEEKAERKHKNDNTQKRMDEKE